MSGVPELTTPAVAGAVLAAAPGEFDVNDLEAVRGGDAVGGGSDCVEGKGHVYSKGWAGLDAAQAGFKSK